MSFNQIPPLETPEFIACNTKDPQWIKIRGGLHWHGPYLDVERARKLRDWLNRALPPEEKSCPSSRLWQRLNATAAVRKWKSRSTRHT